MVVHIAAEKWRTYFASIDSVFVGLGVRRLARMKFRRRFFYGQNTDGRRQKVVQSLAKIRKRNRRLSAHSGYLCPGVYAGIRSAGSLRQSFFASDVFDNGHQSALNRWPVR